MREPTNFALGWGEEVISPPALVWWPLVPPKGTMKKKIVVTTLIVLVLAFTISSAGAQPAQAANSTQVSAGWMPFAGSLYDSQTNSNINLNGLVHIVAHWIGGRLCAASCVAIPGVLLIGLGVYSLFFERED